MAFVRKPIHNLPTFASTTVELDPFLEKGELVVMRLGNINNFWWWVLCTV